MKAVKFIAPMVVLTILIASCIAVPAPTPEVELTEPALAITGKAVPNSVLVRYHPGTPPEKRREARALANGKVVKEYKLVPGLEKLTVVDTPAALQALRHQPFVLYAEPDYVVSIDDPSRQPAQTPAAAPLAAEITPNDPRLGELWGMANIKAPGAWGAATGKPELVVAIIDTGIDYTHPDLAANIWTNPGETAGDGKDNDGNGYVDDVYGYDFANNDGDPMDDHFHGTHTAGTVGAVGNNGIGVVGVNWQVKLMALKFLGASGSGSVSGAVSALEYAVAKRVRLSNNSWGGGGYSQALYDAIKNSQAIGHVFVAAAGNSGVNSDLQPAYPASYDLDNIISVAAIDSSDNLASFSNRGVVTVDLAAPGVAVLSTVLGGGYASYNGTSMAAPHVTGAAALALGLHPDWDHARLKHQILATTRAVAALVGRILTGGVLNADAAINTSDPGPLPTPAPTPVAPPPTPLAPFTSYAQRDVAVEGRVQGSYQDTWTSDGVAESITERSTTGQPDTRYDQLEHGWLFQIPAGRPVSVFRATTWAPVSTDKDIFQFEYATIWGEWNSMFTVVSTTQTDAVQEYRLPPSVSGKNVYVRVRDSNRTPPSWKTTDTVYVDAMSITSSAQ